MKTKILLTLLLLISFASFSQTDLNVDGNLQLNHSRSTIFFQGEYFSTHRGGIKFLTFDSGNTFVFQTTDASNNPTANSTLRIGGFGSFYSTPINLAVSGKVGIGTTIPDEALAVKGKIHAQEVKVDMSVPGPDYVFEQNYALLSLVDLSKYIQENKHLPEVPSAKEMEQNGVNLGNMNLLLLKKVEELTLYVIELEKEVRELKNTRNK